jgi:hypothetical protein
VYRGGNEVCEILKTYDFSEVLAAGCWCWHWYCGTGTWYLLAQLWKMAFLIGLALVPDSGFLIHPLGPRMMI